MSRLPPAFNAIDEVLQSCPCRLGRGLDPHPVVGTSLPSFERQAYLSLDIMVLEGDRFLHCVDHCTGWSELARLCNRTLAEQVRVFKNVQLLRHDVPRHITADGEYGKQLFRDMCEELEIGLTTTPGHSHQSNGRIERANRSVRDCFNQLRACDRKAATSDIAAEAVYAKSVCHGHALASPFELLYGRAPLLTGTDQPARHGVPSVEENAAHAARLKTDLMMRKKVRRHDEVQVGDQVHIWRDRMGWVGPAPVKALDPYKVTVIHNGYEKSDSRNRVRFVNTPEVQESSNATEISGQPSAAKHDPPFSPINVQSSTVPLNRWPLSAAGLATVPEALNPQALQPGRVNSNGTDRPTDISVGYNDQPKDCKEDLGEQPSDSRSGHSESIATNEESSTANTNISSDTQMSSTSMMSTQATYPVIRMSRTPTITTQAPCIQMQATSTAISTISIQKLSATRTTSRQARAGRQGR